MGNQPGKTVKNQQCLIVLIDIETQLNRKETNTGRHRTYLCLLITITCSDETKATHFLAVTPGHIVGNYGSFHHIHHLTELIKKFNNN